MLNCCALGLPCCVSYKNFYGEGADGYWTEGTGLTTSTTSSPSRTPLTCGSLASPRTRWSRSPTWLHSPPTRPFGTSPGPGWEGAYTLRPVSSRTEILGGSKSTWHYNDEGKFLWASDCKQTYALRGRVHAHLQDPGQDQGSTASGSTPPTRPPTRSTPPQRHPLHHARQPHGQVLRARHRLRQGGTQVLPQQLHGSDAGSSTPAPTAVA